MDYTNALIYLIAGLSTITLIDTVGSIASRKLNFKYIYLIPLSLAAYIVIGYLVSKEYGLPAGLLVNGLMGFYDGTIGAKLSVILKANMGLNPEKANQLSKGRAAGFMILVGFVFALIGFLLSRA